MLVRGRGFGPRALRSGYRSAGGAAAPAPFETLQAALGADHVGHWEAPATDDATIDITASRVSSLSSMVGGNALVQATGANQPLWHAPGALMGIGGEGAIEQDSSARYLEAALSVAAGRYGLFVVARPRSTSTSVHIYTNVLAGADDSYLGVDWDIGGGVRAYPSRAAFSTGEVTVNPTTPVPYFDTWRLHALLPYASGMLYQIDGTTVSPNFASSNPLRAIDTVRWGAASFSGGIVKAIILIDNIDATKAQAVRDYVLARWPLVGTPLARIVYAGQSNVDNQDITDFVELPGYTMYKHAVNGSKIADWLNPSTPFTDLTGIMAFSPPAPYPLPFVWDQGNSDCEFEVDADAYVANRETLRSDIETAIGRSLFEIEFTITMTSGAYPYVSTVNAAKSAYVSGRGAANAVLIDSSSLAGGLVDGVHDDATRLAAKLVAIREALVTADLLP